MLAVIFELCPRSGQEEGAYLGLAASLRPKLDVTDGFLSIERFRSIAEPNRLLSLSFFRDEHAVQAWRNLPEHRSAQEQGRNGILANYRLSVAEVVRQYGMADRAEAPADSRSAHERLEPHSKQQR